MVQKRWYRSPDSPVTRVQGSKPPRRSSGRRAEEVSRRGFPGAPPHCNHNTVTIPNPPHLNQNPVSTPHKITLLGPGVGAFYFHQINAKSRYIRPHVGNQLSVGGDARIFIPRISVLLEGHHTPFSTVLTLDFDLIVEAFFGSIFSSLKCFALLPRQRSAASASWSSSSAVWTLVCLEGTRMCVERSHGAQRLVHFRVLMF